MVSGIAGTGVSCTVAAGNSGSAGKKIKVLIETNDISTSIRIILRFDTGKRY